MNKLKELWGRNKVLIVLGIILVICLITIGVVTISFFFGGSKSVYGERLDEVEKYPVSDTFKKEYITSLEANDSITSVKIDVKGRIIYVSINFGGDVPLVDAQSKAAASLSLFSEDLLSYYDINFTLRSIDTENSEGFVILGARNVSGSGSVVWNNNTPVESGE